MFRFGIHSLKQLKEDKYTDILGKDKNISIKLYADLTDEDEDVYEKYSELILNRFNTKSNAIKRTYRNRFNKFDDLTVEVIKSRNFEPVKIHDMAVSDGRASCYFLDRVVENFKDAEYQGSDLAVSYNLYGVKETPGTYAVSDDEQQIIEITKPPFVWNYARGEGAFYFINNWLKAREKAKFDRLIRSGKFGEAAKISVADKVYKKTISKHKNFKLVNYDLFKKSNSTFNVIRVMNILHYGYFNAEQLEIILDNIFNAITLGGLFIEGSNEDAGSEVEGNIYERTELGFKLVMRGEKPSRIETAVLSFGKKY